jgi:hypothetical protein
MIKTNTELVQGQIDRAWQIAGGRICPEVHNDSLLEHTFEIKRKVLAH